MRLNIKIIIAAALLAPTFALTAHAEEAVSYPRVIGTGENASVKHGPGPGQNIVGGGFARVIGSGENSSVEYQGPVRSQSLLFAYAIGSGENTVVVYSTSPDRDFALVEAGVLPFAPALATALPAITGNRG